MTWPFTRAKPGGYVENDVPAPSEINKMDEQISLAADGTLWTDIAAVANWLYSWDGGGSGDAIRYVWREGSRRWLVAGISGSDPAISDVIPPLSAPTLIAKSVPTSTAMSALTAFAANPSGVLLLAGTTGGANNLRRSDDGNTWTAESTLSNTNAVGALGWFEAAGLWIAGYTAGTAIDTSPDGITWTARTAPNNNARSGIAFSPALAILVSSATTNLVLTSEDGVVWTERDVGASAIWSAVTYNDVLGMFFILSSTGGVRKSEDGITWTAVTSLSAVEGGQLRSIGRLVVAFGITGTGTNVYVSADAGTTWVRVARLPTAASNVAVGPGGQVIVNDPVTGVAWATLRLGL